MSSPASPNATWIHRLDEAALALEVARVAALAPAAAPLRGLRLAIKDNIDLGGVPTTAACPGFAYTPTTDAPVVARLRAAGAVALGKTNLDQFATGLVGVRSPYGVPENVLAPDWIPGGSSSGSAVAVARGEADIALGTDTAGSGRVPAALNGIVGLKPSRGLLSTRGVVPACRSLDCVSLFARDIATAVAALAVAAHFDPEDPWARALPQVTTPLPPRPRLGIPRLEHHEWYGNAESPRLFAAALERWLGLGVELVEIDLAPFLETARLLYEGPWVAERYAAVGAFIEAHATPEQAARVGLDPTVRDIILGGRRASAVDAFRAQYRLAELRRAAERELVGLDALIVPTFGAPATVAAVQADPVVLNSRLGRTNNFMNLLDLCGLTLPAGRYANGPGFGITLCAPAGHDHRLLALGARFLGEPVPAWAPAAAPADGIALAVCGAHLRGQPLHAELLAQGAVLLAATHTAPRYRLHALETRPPKPGLVRAETGAAIELEVYSLPPLGFARFVAAVPPPLAIGNIELADGAWVKGFLCEPGALAGARDLTAHGGWRAALAAL